MENLGIQPISLLLQSINFLLLLLILKKFLYKPILKVLADRKKKIEEGLSYSDKMKSEFEKSEKKRDEILVRARSDGKTIIEEAKRAAKKREEELLEKAQREAQEIIAKGKREIEAMKEDLAKDLRLEAVMIAEKIVEKVIKEALTENTQKALIDRKIKEIAKSNI